MNPKRVCRWFAAVVLVAAAAQAAGSAPYQISVELWIEGHQLDVPAVAVARNRPAELIVSDNSAPDRPWKLVVATDSPPASAGIVWLDISIFEQGDDGQWALLADSLLGLSDSGPATMSVTGDGQGEPTPASSLVYLTAALE
ncbi:MAG TPA: hypothetical protein VK064_07780 [Wenzhouxiangella sp.]|nr:hypothetical protein [Wenzhouxiangella sp.]